MRVIAKILFIFLFLIFGLTNFVDANDFCSSASISNKQDEMHCDIFATLDTESYIIIPTNNNDSSGLSGNIGFKNFNHFEFDSFFSEKYINKNFNNIAFLFKTEVFPNAP